MQSYLVVPPWLLATVFDEHGDKDDDDVDGKYKDRDADAVLSYLMVPPWQAAKPNEDSCTASTME